MRVSKREIVLFGAGSPIAVKYEETCLRLGGAIAAVVRNRPGATFLLRGPPPIEPEALDAVLLRTPFLCPLFTPLNRQIASGEALALGMTLAAPLVDPTAILASSVDIGAGSFVNAGVTVGAGRGSVPMSSSIAPPASGTMPPSPNMPRSAPAPCSLVRSRSGGRR